MYTAPHSVLHLASFWNTLVSAQHLFIIAFIIAVPTSVTRKLPYEDRGKWQTLPSNAYISWTHYCKCYLISKQGISISLEPPGCKFIEVKLSLTHFILTQSPHYPGDGQSHSKTKAGMSMPLRSWLMNAKLQHATSIPVTAIEYASF